MHAEESIKQGETIQKCWIIPVSVKFLDTLNTVENKLTNIYINKNITNTVFHTHARVILKSGIRMIEVNFHVNILDNT